MKYLTQCTLVAAVLWAVTNSYAGGDIRTGQPNHLYAATTHTLVTTKAKGTSDTDNARQQPWWTDITAFEFDGYRESYRDNRTGGEAFSYTDTYGNLEASFTYAPSVLSGNITVNLGLSDNLSATLDEAWLRLDLSNASTLSQLTLGVQPAYDERGWLYDSTLDLLSLYNEGASTSFYLGAGTDSPQRNINQSLSPADNPVRRWIASATHAVSDSSQITVNLASQRQQPDNDTQTSLYWGSVLTSGQLALPEQRADYWAQLGVVTGEEIIIDQSSGSTRTISIDGWAFDAGLTWQTQLPGRPEITAAFARTSKDNNTSDKRDTGYRQTGIQSNSADIGSFSSVPYYGFVVAPELSNLTVATLTAGYPLLTNSYVYVKSHQYRQSGLTNSLRNFSADLALTGRSTDIGRALDIELNYAESARWSTSLTIGYFKPGKGVQSPRNLLHYSLLNFNYWFQQ